MRGQIAVSAIVACFAARFVEAGDKPVLISERGAISHVARYGDVRFALNKYSTVISGDGRLIFELDRRRVNVWDALSGALLAGVDRPEAPQYDSALAASRNGDRLLVGVGGEILVFDIPARKLVRRIESGAAKCRGYALAPDLDLVAAFGCKYLDRESVPTRSSTKLSELAIWRPSSGDRLRTLLVPGDPELAEFLDDGARIMAVGDAPRGRSTWLWDTADGRLLYADHMGGGAPTHIVVLPDGHRVLRMFGQSTPIDSPGGPLGPATGTIISVRTDLLDLDTDDAVQLATDSPSGARVAVSGEHAVACSKQGLEVWRIRPAARVVSIPVPAREVNALGIARAGDIVVAAGAGETHWVAAWSVPEGKLLWRRQGASTKECPDYLKPHIAVQDGARIVLAGMCAPPPGRHSSIALDLRTGHELAREPGWEVERAALFSPAYRRLFLANEARSYTAIDLSSFRSVLAPDVQPGAIVELALSADGRKVIAVSGPGALLRDRDTGGLLAKLAPGGTLSDATFTPDSAHLAAVLDHSVVQWSLPELKQIVVVQPSQHRSQPRLWNQGRLAVFFGTDARWAEISDVPPTGPALKTAPKDEKSAACAGRIWTRFAAARRDGAVIAPSDDEDLRICRLGDAPILGSVRIGGQPSSRVVLAPGEQVAAAGTQKGDVVLWRLDRNQTRTLRGHDGAVSALAFADGGRLLLSGGEDGEVKLWRVADGVLLDTIHWRLLADRPTAIVAAATATDQTEFWVGTQRGALDRFAIAPTAGRGQP